MARKRVTYTQLESLWEFLDQNRSIATGYNKTAQAREYSKRMWQAVALNLNSQGEGAEKDWKGWSKHWNDFKSKLKAKVAAARASQRRTGGGPSSEATLTEQELKFLQILGEDFGAGLPGARVDPFNDPSSDVERVADVEGVAGVGRVADSLPEASVDAEVTGGGGGSGSILLNVVLPEPQLQFRVSPSQSPLPQQPVVRSPPPSVTPAASPAPRTQAASASTPPRRRGLAQRSPRSTAPRSPRRRIRRRELPMTMDTARRTLIAISEQRAAEDRRRNDILQTLVREIVNIKETLNSRLPELPSTDVLEQL